MATLGKRHTGVPIDADMADMLEHQHPASPAPDDSSRSGGGRRKKQKKEKPKTTKTYQKKLRYMVPHQTHSVAFMTDVWKLVVDFVDHRSLLHLMMTHNAVRLSLSHDVVFKSVLLGGMESSKLARCTLDLVMNALRTGAICVPTPMRLLRLCNGRRCERPGCNREVHHVRPGWGVFYCEQCKKSHGTAKIRNLDPIGQLLPLLGHRLALFEPKPIPENAPHDYVNFIYVWRAPLIDVDEGSHRVGPTITLQDIEAYMQGGGPLTGEALRAHVDASADMPDPAVVRSYDELVEMSKAFHGKIKAGKAQGKAKLALYKGELYAKVVATLAEEIGDTPWRETALQSRHVMNLLAPHKRAPSRANKKAIRGMADRIRNDFGRLHSNGFFALSFLAEAPAADPAATLAKPDAPLPSAAAAAAAAAVEAPSLAVQFDYLLRAHFSRPQRCVDDVIINASEEVFALAMAGHGREALLASIDLSDLKEAFLASMPQRLPYAAPLWTELCMVERVKMRARQNKAEAAEAAATAMAAAAAVAAAEAMAAMALAPSSSTAAPVPSSAPVSDRSDGDFRSSSA